MAKKSKKTEVLPVEKPKPKACGEVFSKDGQYLGRYIFIQNQEDLDELCEYWLERSSHSEDYFLTVDLETEGLDPYSGNIILYAITDDGNNAVVVDHRAFDLTLLKKVLETVPINNQNISFDFKWILHHHGVEMFCFHDTMVAAQLGWAGAFAGNSYSLENLAKQILKIEVAKETRKEFINFSGELTEEQVAYAATDAIVTHRLVVPELKRLTNTGLLDIWYKTERPLIPILAKSEYFGFKADIEKLTQLRDELVEQLDAVYNQIQEELQNIPLPESVGTKGFNPMSPKQVLDVMAAFGVMLPDTTESTINKYAVTSNCKMLQLIHEYKKIRGMLSKFVDSWLTKYINPKTGCIHANFKSMGAATGRVTVSAPNLQATTRDGKIRGCLVAREGKKIIVSDYSSFEFRCCAAATGEEYLIESFRMRADMLPEMKKIARSHNYTDVDTFCKHVLGGKIQVGDYERKMVEEFVLTDVHRRNAAIIFNVDVRNVTPEQRTSGKCVSLDTLVYTDKGVVEIGSLLPKNPQPDTFYDLPEPLMVWTDDGFKPATKIYYNGPSEVIEIEFRSGRRIWCTPKHKFRAFGDRGSYVWKEAKRLEAKQYVAAAFKLPLDYKPSKDQVLKAKILGELLRDFEGPNENPRMLDYLSKKYARSEEYSQLGPEKIRKIIDEVCKTCLKDGVLTLPKTFYKSPILAAHMTAKVFSKKRDDTFIQSFDFGRYKLHRDLQVLLQSLGIETTISGRYLIVPGSYVTKLHELSSAGKVPQPKVTSHMSPALIERTWEVRVDMGFDAPLEAYKGCLSAKEFEMVSKFSELDIRKDRVRSIRILKNLVPTADLSVPSNHTVVYNGLVSHNTLGYSVLYAAGPKRVQESLIREGYNVTRRDAETFIRNFFDKMKKVDQFIKDTQAFIEKNGYVQNFLGRKRFFNFPPKWKTREYESYRAEAFREGVNCVFQSTNCDATKNAIIRMTNRFHFLYPENPPVVLLTVHDENVVEAPAEIAEDVGAIVEEEMVQSGIEATANKVPIETSLQISDTWLK